MTDPASRQRGRPTETFGQTVSRNVTSTSMWLRLLLNSKTADFTADHIHGEHFRIQQHKCTLHIHPSISGKIKPSYDFD
jgi:hypothetical protein